MCVQLDTYLLPCERYRTALPSYEGTLFNLYLTEIARRVQSEAMFGSVDEFRCQADPSTYSKSEVLVSSNQRGNAALRFISNVYWSLATVVPDFVISASTCVIYISARFHVLHPDYLRCRILELRHNQYLCVVICIIDLEDATKALREINKISNVTACALVCTWSPEESARYVELLKANEGVSPSFIQGNQENDFISKVHRALTGLRDVNKIDAVTLCDNFGTLATIIRKTRTLNLMSPGVGPTKLRQVFDALHRPLCRPHCCAQV